MPDIRKLRRGPRRRVPRPLEPRGIQLRYYQELKRLLSYAEGLVKERLVSKLPELFSRLDTAHLDAQPPGKRVNSILNGISKTFYAKWPQAKLEALGERIARSTSEHQKGQLFRQVKALIGVELKTIADRGLSATIKQFTAENVALIQTLPQRYFDDIERVVLEGMRAGSRHEDLAAQLEERLGVAESRAQLIARDQVLKFNGELNEVRQQSLGIDSYIWRTVNDVRVRPEHEELDGQTFRWDEPPSEGHPGEAIRCRCYAEGILPED